MKASDVARAMYPDYKEERAAAIARQFGAYAVDGRIQAHVVTVEK